LLRRAEILGRLNPLTGPLSYFRFIGNREAIEKVMTTFNRIVVDKSEELAECALAIEAMARRAPVVVFVNDQHAGYAPATAPELHRLLGMPEPVPLPRPRTTLFD